MNRLPLRPAAAAVVLSALALAAQAASPSHVYQLNGSLADQNGGPPLVADGGTLDATGYSFAPNQGLSLSNVLGSVYTIDFESSFSSLNGFRKLVDFKDRGADAGLYNLNAALNFYPVTTGSVSAFATDTLARVTITRDGAGLFTGYVNGVQQIQFTDSSSRATFSGPAQIAHFFEDDGATGFGEASAGRANYIQIFDSALSAADVATLGAPAPVPEPQTYALMLAGLLLTAGAARARGRR